jgi:3-hydroxyisobutyrate dehydrogenase-like beta-hydroxyacid dehydrogenase
MQLGFVGLGRMGQAMVPRLLAAGYTVTVWNRTPARAEPLLAAGAVWADTPAALASRSDLVITIVTNDAAVEDLYNPTDGLLGGDVAGMLFLEMSTIRPDTIHRIVPLVARRGASLLDAPVSGTVPPARDGQLIAMVGGSSEDLERARPVLDVLCRHIEHLGPNGSGAMMKLVLNMPMAVYWHALAEALAMGTQAGLDLEQMLNLIVDSPAAITFLRAKLDSVLGTPGEVTFDITGVRKDLLAMTATGHLLGVPTPSASAALGSYAAASNSAWGSKDVGDFIRYYIEMVHNTTSQG